MGVGQKRLWLVFTGVNPPNMWSRWLRKWTAVSSRNAKHPSKRSRLVPEIGATPANSMRASPRTPSPWQFRWPFFSNYLNKQTKKQRNKETTTNNRLRKENSERLRQSLMRKFCQTNCCLLSPSSLAHRKVSDGAWVSSTGSWKLGINVRFCIPSNSQKRQAANMWFWNRSAVLYIF